MNDSIIIYETFYGTSKKVAKIFGKILNNSKVYSINKVSKDFKKYNNVIIVFSFHGYDTAKRIKRYFMRYKDNLDNKKILLIGVGVLDFTLNKYAEDIRKVLRRKEDYLEFIEGELRINKLSLKDKNTIKSFLEKVNMEFKDMGSFNEDEVYKIALKYINII